MTRLLLVEDNPDNADLVLALLEDEYEMHVCSSAQDALDYIDSTRHDLPKLLLLDISLPGMDGVELLRHLRGDPDTGHLPAIALTAHAMKDDRNRLLAAGFDEYVSKPVDETTLVATIEGLLDGNV